MYRLAIVTTHPVQYHGPWFRKLAAHPQVDVTVFFCCDHGVKVGYDPGFGQSFAWDTPITDGYKHEFVPNIHPHPGPQSFFSRTNPALWQRLSRTNFDAVLVLGWAFASTWLSVAAARAHGVGILLHAESNLGPPGRPLWKELLRRRVLRDLFARCDAFLAVGQLSAELFHSYGAPQGRVFVTPYAVDNEFFEQERLRMLPQRVALRAALGVDDERPIIVTSGKLIERKAPLELLDAFVHARRSVEAKLVFLGDGELRPAIERRAHAAGVGDDVIITGFKNQRELGGVYVAADVMVLPSRYETWGLVVNEGMLFGLPVVCSDMVSCHHDLVVQGETGEVYPSGDVMALSDTLTRLLASPEVLHRMGVAGRGRIASWSYDACVVSTVQALAALEAAATTAREPRAHPR
jgi:glycosyltransferase involved in cell wall biosynthesis